MKKLNILILLYWISTILFAETPAGYYYKANNKNGYELLNTLNIICSNGDFLSYGSGEGYTWEGFYYTDRNDDGSVIDMYSSTIRYQTDFNAVDGLHIEHSLPKSWWGALENYAFRDLHHLFPADATTNITKNNLPLGEVETATFDNGVSKIGTTSLYNSKEKCFEPADEYKGDFARAYFYVSTVYNELSALWQSSMMQNNTYPVWNNEALDLLLKWHREDPVSTKELKRQEAVYQIQHNRNPFIDYPEMVEHIWGNKKDIAISLPKETRPFLTTPTAWTSIEIPVSYTGTTTSKTIRFEGANFTKNIKVTLLNKSTEITLSKTEITPQEITSGYDLSISIFSNETKTIIDTLLICTTDTIKIPIAATFTDEFMITETEIINPISANITYTELPNTQYYEITLRDAPDNRTCDLMFSGYAEGSAYNKAISIYNGTGKPIDLKYYSLRKQSNGTEELKLDYPLSGTLANNECYVIVSSRANETLKAMANHVVPSPLDEDNILNFNGNDAIGLYHNGILIDVIGEVNNSADWGKDMSLKRNASTISPNKDFNWNEWNKLSKDDFSHLKNHNVTLNKQSNIIATYQSNGNRTTIDNLTPNSIYYIEVKANNMTSVNILPLKTPNIVTPEAYEATEIYATQFTANWEKINYAEGYIIDLMQTAGGEEITIEENFDSVGSNGKPLPEGWTSTASGNYTSAASSGKSVPSIALKNSGEYIQTPTCSSPITYIEFMYRFPSKTATDSYFIVYSVDSQGELTQIDKIKYANTTKTTQTYADLKNAYAIRIEYHKAEGNLAIDDIIYRCSGKTNQIIRSEETTNNFYIFNNLTANTEYMYQIRAIVGEDCLSETSNIIYVKTNSTPTSTNIESNFTPTLYTINNTLYVEGLSANSVVTIYNISGIKIYQTTLSSQSTHNVQLSKGIYIAQINNKQHIKTIKFVIK